MAQITFDIPNNQLTRILNAAATAWNYPSTVVVDDVEVANPQTKAQFVKERMRRFLMDAVKRAEGDAAAATARATAESEITIS